MARVIVYTNLRLLIASSAGGCGWLYLECVIILVIYVTRSVNWFCVETVFVISLVVNWMFVIMGGTTGRYVACHHVQVLSLGSYLANRMKHTKR
jgi:hypothetical protein